MKHEHRKKAPKKPNKKAETSRRATSKTKSYDTIAEPTLGSETERGEGDKMARSNFLKESSAMVQQRKMRKHILLFVSNVHA